MCWSWHWKHISNQYCGLMIRRPTCIMAFCSLSARLANITVCKQMHMSIKMAFNAKFSVTSLRAKLIIQIIQDSKSDRFFRCGHVFSGARWCWPWWTTSDNTDCIGLYWNSVQKSILGKLEEFIIRFMNKNIDK